METRAPADGTFQLVPSPEPGVWDFRVFCNYGVPRADTAVAAGTTYANATGLTARPHVHDATWAAYVAGRREEVGGGLFWQHFVRALPTTPTITEVNDPIFGKCYEHAYDDLTSNPTPEVADMLTYNASLTLTMLDGTAVTLLDGTTPVTLLGQRIVRAVRTEDLGQGLQRVIVTTAANAEVEKTETQLDEESGTMLDITKIYTITATRPAAVALSTSTGLFTEVAPYEHNVWLRTRRKASVLPASRAEAVAWDTTGAIYWPAVLESSVFTVVVDDDLSSYRKLFSYILRDPYAGEVRVTRRRWFQYTAPTVTAPVTMLPSGIKVDGRQLNFSIPECLHAEFTAEEWNAVATLIPGGINEDVNQMVVWTFAATAQTDWPESITKTKVNFTRGGYDCQEEIYYRPENYNSALLTVSQRNATAAEVSLGV